MSQLSVEHLAQIERAEVVLCLLVESRCRI